MLRNLLLLAACVVAAALIILCLPGWQSRFISPGDRIDLDLTQNRLGVTFGVKNERDRYFVVSPETAAEMTQGSTFTPSPGGVLEHSKAEVTGGEVVWTTTENKRTITHSAPGAHLYLQTAVKLGPDATSPAEVRWSSPAYALLAEKADTRLRHGPAKVDGASLLLARYEVTPPGLARMLALFRAAAVGGLPLVMPFMTLAICLWGLPAVPKQPAPERGALPMVFERSLRSIRTNLALWAGIFSLPICIIGIVTLVTERSLVDVAQSLRVNGWIGFSGLLFVGFVFLLIQGFPRAATVDFQGVEIRTGLGGKKRFTARWEELSRARAMERLKGGKVIAEWLEFRTQSGRKITVAQHDIQHYPLLREAVQQLAPPAIQA